MIPDDGSALRMKGRKKEKCSKAEFIGVHSLGAAHSLRGGKTRPKLLRIHYSFYSLLLLFLCVVGIKRIFHAMRPIQNPNGSAETAKTCTHTHTPMPKPKTRKSKIRDELEKKKREVK